MAKKKQVIEPKRAKKKGSGIGRAAAIAGGVLAAGAAGVAAGMLLSPKSGKENRRWLKGKGKQAVRVAKTDVRKLKKAAVGTANRVQREVESRLSKAGKKPVKAKKAGKSASRKRK